MDFLPSAVGDCDAGADVVDPGHGLAHHVVAPRIRKLYRHDYSATREGDDVHASAVLRVGAVRHRLPSVAGISAAGGGGRPSVDGPGGRNELLPPQRPGG